ncbi:NACHT and WD repeat domain-containing protein 2-like [Watersipora subatra]|uniref:NACHT and WD repeat domain-containing protein 2-like n=1 Tax=Watersipora subatra TaxID=2589382 RepID=UPI00355BB5F2
MGDSSKNAAPEEGSLQLSVTKGSVSNLPQERKNVIKIFLSSTFTDMKAERNMLMSAIFPRLKKYCQENYKLEFQVVDMRWGVQDQASDDHSTSELCMREVLNCQRESAGPNFVCLLGDRYGTTYLKRYISEEHWTILLSRIRSTEVKQLLEVWYKLDTNSASPQRVLQPISSVENGSAQWEKSSTIMHSALRDAAAQAKNDGELSKEIAQSLICSVTEEEITCTKVLSHIEAGDKTKCLAFFRHINDINLQHERARKYLDLDDSNERDSTKQAIRFGEKAKYSHALQLDPSKYQSAFMSPAFLHYSKLCSLVGSDELLSKLKEKVKEALPPDNIREYEVSWSDAGINTEAHKEYLKNFGEDFYEQVRRLIDSAVKNQDESLKEVFENDVTREVLSHSRQALDKLSKVVPRSDILDQVKTYVIGDSNYPLVVHGHSGCGKTSIMASVAKEAREWLKAEKRNVEAVVLRFLGTTPSSSDIEHLLQSVIAQLRMINSSSCSADFSKLSSEPLKSLIEQFRGEITAYAEDWGTLIIVIDSVDQLRESDAAFSLSWLPLTLPKNVKFIISTLPDIYGILKSAQSLDVPKDNFVEVKALDEESAWTIIDKWLELYKRKISNDQRQALSLAFKGKSLPPLYIKLVFDILIKWKSYSQADSIPTDVTACMDQLFTNLENAHGKRQVQLALAYLTCCPGGISESELEDTLSIDDEFLSAVYQYHIPPVRRIPPDLWVRIKNDIREYLVEKESHGVAALFWYHRQFIEYATRRYTREEESTQHSVKTLCDYFNGRWSDSAKPFTYTTQQMEKLKLSNSSGEGFRYVASQPTKYGQHQFNSRKISVLSQLWSSSAMRSQVYRNSAAYIMDIEFLTGKFLVDSWISIDRELSSMREFMKEQTALGGDQERYRIEYSYVHEVLKMYSGLIARAPLALSAQLFACLQDKYNLSQPIPPSESDLPNIAWFLTQLLGTRGVELSPLLPVSKILASPGGMQLVSRLHSSPCKILPLRYQDKSLVAILSDELVLYVLENNGSISELYSISLPCAPENGTFVSFGSEENYIFVGHKERFSLVSLENKRIEFHSDKLVLVSLLKDGFRQIIVDFVN